MKRPNAVAVFPVIVLVAVALIGGYEFGSSKGEERATDTYRATSFVGAVVSVYSDDTGGCVRPEQGHDVPDSEPDGTCGPWFWATQSPPEVGDRVQVTLVRGRDQSDADIQSLLVSAP